MTILRDYKLFCISCISLQIKTKIVLQASNHPEKVNGPTYNKIVINTFEEEF